MLCIINLQTNLTHCLWIYMLVSFFGKRFRLGRWLIDWWIDSLTVFYPQSFPWCQEYHYPRCANKDTFSLCRFVFWKKKKERKKQQKWNRLCKMYIVFRTLGAFHSVENLSFGNSGKNSNGTDRFGSVRPECLGPPLKVIYFDRSSHFGSLGPKCPFPFDNTLLSRSK